MEVSTKQLEHFAQMAQSGRTVRNVAHAVNNALGAMVAYAELIKMDTRDPEVRRMLEGIFTSAEKSTTLLKALTSIARDTPSDSSALTSTQDVLEAVELLFAYEVKMLKIEWSISVEDNLPNVRIEAANLQRIIMHLVANALEALSEASEKTTSIHARLSGDKVAITVQDSAPEISATRAEELFTPLLTTKGDGHHGMGLSTARSLAQAAHGDLVYRAHEGFCLTLPTTRCPETKS